MASIDEICSCDYETTYTFCMCCLPKEEAQSRCRECSWGNHSMELKDVLSTQDGKP